MRGGSRSGMACAFVRFQTQAMAQSAIDAVHGRITLPKAAEPLVVRWADAPGSRKRDAREGGRKSRGGGVGGGAPVHGGAGISGSSSMDPNWGGGNMMPMMNGGVYGGGSFGPGGGMPHPGLAPLNFQQMGGGFAAQQGMMGQPGMLGGAQFGAQFGFAGQQGGFPPGAGGFPGAAAGLPMPTVGFAPQQQLMALYSIEQAAAMQQQAFWPMQTPPSPTAPPMGGPAVFPQQQQQQQQQQFMPPAHQAQPPVRLPPPLPEASRTGGDVPLQG